MDSSESITIRFAFTLADAVESFRLYDATTPRHTITRIIALLSMVFAGLATYACVQLIRLYGSTYGTEWCAIVLFALALILWFDLILSLRAWFVFRMNSRIYTDESEVTFDEYGVHAKTSTYDMKRLWTAYSRVLESDRLFLLIYGKGVYATIPKRAFSDERQLLVFRELLNRRIGN
jgi:hypothetical protein